MSIDTIVCETFSHMGCHSGYDLLYFSLQAEGRKYRRVCPDKLLYRKFLRRRIAAHALHVVPDRSKFYGPANFLAELETCIKSFRSSKIIHILYGENNLGIYSIPHVKCRKKLVVTIHQPFSWWKDHGLDIRKKFYTTDALIVLTNQERDHFENILGKKVYFIPHGIDTKFFIPPTELQLEKKLNSPEKRCLFVGQWLRDFETLFAVITEILDKEDEIFFDLVVPDLSGTAPDIEKRFVEFENHAQVLRHKNIDDDALLNLYRDATLLFLPLEKSTANNAILEAMACGLPIVTSLTGGIADYTDSSYAVVCPPKDTDAMAEAVLKIAYNPHMQKTMGYAARNSAEEKFDWGLIARQVIKIYKKILVEGCEF